jgi:hypothetical protein
MVVAAHLEFCRGQGQIGEVSVPVDPLLFAKQVAPLADGLEVIGEQSVQAIGVGVKFSVAELLVKIAEVSWSAPGWVEALIPGKVWGYGTPEEVLR